MGPTLPETRRLPPQQWPHRHLQARRHPNRVNRGPTDGKLHTAAVVRGWNLFRKQDPDFKGSEDGKDIEAIYDIDGDSEDASPTPTMTDKDYGTLDALLTKIIDHPADG